MNSNVRESYLQKLNELQHTNYRGIILMDMDEVLFDMIEDWLYLYNLKFNDTLTKEQILHWDTYRFVKEECGLEIYSLLKHEGLFRNLKPAKYAQEVVQRLMDNGFDIRVVSDSPNGYSYCSGYASKGNPADDKRQALKEHFPMINQKNVIFASEKWYVYGDVMVDDKPSTFETFRNLNRNAILVDQPYNQEITTQYRAKDMLEVEKNIYKFFNI